MENRIFGDMVFDSGWITKETTCVDLWGKNFDLQILIQAYYETEAVTAAQAKVFIMLRSEWITKIAELEQFVECTYPDMSVEDILKTFTPTLFYINTEGELALLFDDNRDVEAGIAVVIYPKFDVLAQDEYL